MRQFTQFPPLVVRQQRIELIKPRDILLRRLNKPTRQIGLRLIVALPHEPRSLPPRHEIGLDGAKSKVEGVGLVLPAVVIALLVGELGGCDRRSRGGILVARGREELFDKYFDDFEIGGDDGELIGVWDC